MSLVQALSLRHPPLALYYAPEMPPEAKSMKSGGTSWGCAMFLLGPALEGKTVAFSLETCHCPGASQGLGLADRNDNAFPGGRETFARFLSSGNEHYEEGRMRGQKMAENGAAPDAVEEFLKGEGFKKNPELADDFLSGLPKAPLKGPVVILEPLSKVKPETAPEAVIVLADAMQLSALVVLANYARRGVDNVRIPFGSGCQSIGLFPMGEAAGEAPKAVVGLTDISARLYLKKLLGRDLLSFAMPWSLYLEMENNVDESFLTRHAWLKLNE
ncbi:MAG: DUF169 domain-containing protein [Candidatus Adiutrix sp.]|jgi:hypothetical protein|nr:DUF169 domain-containing protein [Candidatus Adiutrix sp.]